MTENRRKENFEIYLKRRKEYKEKIDKQIVKEYKKMKSKNLDRGFIISTIRNKYRKPKGGTYSVVRIYNALKGILKK
jgi:hypothetical protein